MRLGSESEARGGGGIEVPRRGGVLTSRNAVWRVSYGWRPRWLLPLLPWTLLLLHTTVSGYTDSTGSRERETRDWSPKPGLLYIHTREVRPKHHLLRARAYRVRCLLGRRHHPNSSQNNLRPASLSPKHTLSHTRGGVRTRSSVPLTPTCVAFSSCAPPAPPEDGPHRSGGRACPWGKPRTSRTKSSAGSSGSGSGGRAAGGNGSFRRTWERGSADAQWHHDVTAAVRLDQGGAAVPSVGGWGRQASTLATPIRKD